MQSKKSKFLCAIAVIGVLTSYQAVSDPQIEDQRLPDVNAFSEAWSGQYYQEPSVEKAQNYENFEAKKNYFLDLPDVTYEEVEVHDLLHGPQPSPSPLPGPEAPTFFWSQFLQPPEPVKPSALPKNSDDAPLAGPAQSLYYYDRGSLQNGTEIEDEGKGFIKIFRDRDEATGGRGWGTRTMIALIKRMAANFAELNPGSERLQIADIARKHGGKIGHGSHQNGLDADIVYIRKNHKEQPSLGNFGKNGFAEEFVIRTSKVREFHDLYGNLRKIRSSVSSPSTNFDTASNFQLIKMFHDSGNVKVYFMDRVLVREMFKYAESKNLSKDPEVQAMLMKLDPQASHADHFHVRLWCQSGDSKCISQTAPAHRRVSKKKRSI